MEYSGLNGMSLSNPSLKKIDKPEGIEDTKETCLIDVTGQKHIRSHRDCSSTHRVCTGPGQMGWQEQRRELDIRPHS